MKLIKEYTRLITFAVGILIGVQVPNFIDQYAKRISAHYIEAKVNFSGYQQTADKHFGGNVEALLAHYVSSTDTVFKDDAKNIKQIYKRQQGFFAELKALDRSLFRKIFHVIFYADNDVLQETITEFSYTVPLNHEAIVCGLLLGLILSLIFELVAFTTRKLYFAAFGNRTGLMVR
ncbi:MAG: DUF2937 family protein [Desulfobacterales bacterium]|nr:DUF2937 family protein [Desulfobacterales bacterium]